MGQLRQERLKPALKFRSPICARLNYGTTPTHDIRGESASKPTIFKQIAKAVLL